MRVQVHPFVLDESWVKWSRPCCGPCSMRTHSVQAAGSSTRPFNGRYRWRSVSAISTDGGLNGGAIVARDARAKGQAIRLLLLAQRWSASRLVSRAWAYIFLPSGSTNARPLARLWCNSSRRYRPRSTHIRTTTLPWCITGSRRFCALVGHRQTHGVRYPRASTSDAPEPGVSQRNAASVSGTTGAHQRLGGAD